MSNPVDELLAQRDAVLFGKWKKGSPIRPGEACAVIRYDPVRGQVHLSNDARWSASQALAKLHDGRTNIMAWNDSVAQSRFEVIEVLDEAIRIAKDTNPA